MRKVFGGDKEMKVARNPLEIIAAAGCQGVALGDTEALILLG